MSGLAPTIASRLIPYRLATVLRFSPAWSVCHVKPAGAVAPASAGPPTAATNGTLSVCPGWMTLLVRSLNCMMSSTSTSYRSAMSPSESPGATTRTAYDCAKEAGASASAATTTEEKARATGVNKMS